MSHPPEPWVQADVRPVMQEYLRCLRDTAFRSRRHRLLCRIRYPASCHAEAALVAAQATGYEMANRSNRHRQAVSEYAHLPEFTAKELSHLIALIRPRPSRELMTPRTVSTIVGACLGHVRVACIVGRARSGKTKATSEWLNSQEPDLRPVYVDCRWSMNPDSGPVIHFNGFTQEVQRGHYPESALSGHQIVVIDEPHAELPLVTRVYANTQKDGTGKHQLLVLLVQNEDHFAEFGISSDDARFFTTHGEPISVRQQLVSREMWPAHG